MQILDFELKQTKNVNLPEKKSLTLYPELCLWQSGCWDFFNSHVCAGCLNHFFSAN